MLTLAFRRMRLPMLAMVLTALTWTSCQAIGAFQTRPAFPGVASDDDPRLPPTIIPPNVSATAFIGRCGKGRVSDPQTHGCRGPGDIKNSHKDDDRHDAPSDKGRPLQTEPEFRAACSH